ncbi:MAG: class II aldolase/adducin family protein [Alphaproteobacteria bacterium]
MRFKKEIIDASKYLLQLQFNIGSEGNISYRQKNEIYITPSGIKTSNLKPKDISKVDLNGKVLNKNKPSSEILLHTWIYRNHKDIRAVVHSHSKWASILSCMRISIPSFHYMVAEFGGNNIKCSKYATFGTEKLSRYVNDVLHKRKGCLIANHGQVTIGCNLEEAVDLSIALEKLSEQFYYLWITKQTKLLSDKEMRKIVKLFEDYKAKH